MIVYRLRASWTQILQKEFLMSQTSTTAAPDRHSLPIIRADYHMHTAFSADSSTPMEEQIQAAVSAGLSAVCFTEHVDLDSPFRNAPENDTEGDFHIDYSRYRETFLRLKEQYAEKIQLLFGLEMGLNTNCASEIEDYINAHPELDFVIGSTHSARDRMDPYYDSFFDASCDPYRDYFETALANMRTFCRTNVFDSYGHLDYILRCGPRSADGSCKERTSSYLYAQYADLIDPLLKELISQGKALELNTSPLKKGFPETNPGKAILKRYYELGGRLITIGSDAHVPAAVGYGFDTAAELLTECGFTQYVTYEKRQPIRHEF